MTSLVPADSIEQIAARRLSQDVLDFGASA